MRNFTGLNMLIFFFLRRKTKAIWFFFQCLLLKIFIALQPFSYITTVTLLKRNCYKREKHLNKILWYMKESRNAFPSQRFSVCFHSKPQNNTWFGNLAEVLVKYICLWLVLRRVWKKTQTFCDYCSVILYYCKQASISLHWISFSLYLRITLAENLSRCFLYKISCNS